MNPFGCRHWPSTKGFALAVPYDLLRTYRRKFLVMSYAVGAWRDSAIRLFGSVCAKEGWSLFASHGPSGDTVRNKCQRAFLESRERVEYISECREFLSEKCLKYILAEVERAGTY